MSSSPLILNFDASVNLSGNSTIIDLQHWQEKIRFACTNKSFRQLFTSLQQQLPDDYGPVFSGSGDYHHVSQLLIQLCYQRIQQPLQLIMLDNHPDNMRFPFGIHCGSWVKHAATLPYIKQIHVVGITSNDIALSHVWENYLLPLYSGKVTYWSTQVNTGWTAYLGLNRAIRCFQDHNTLIAAFLNYQNQQSMPVYLSIDKDVMSKTIIETNWDQGCFSDQDVYLIINTLKQHIIASDITGDISNYVYKSRWKKLLTALDKQQPIEQQQLINAQIRQNQINHQLLELLR